MTMHPVGDSHIEILQKDGRFLGFGRVLHGAVNLRDGNVPAVVKLDTPDGVVYPELRVASVADADGGFDLVLNAVGYQTLRMEFQDDYEHQQIPARHDAPSATLTVMVRPDRQTVGDHAFTGFRYAFRVAGGPGARTCWPAGGGASRPARTSS